MKIKTTFVTSLFIIALCSWAFAAMPTDLVLYYSFDSGTVSDEEVTDQTQYGNNGILVGDPVTDAGYRGDALDFTTDAVEIVSSESLAETMGSITMEAWIYPRTIGTAEIISKWDNAMNGIIHFELRDGGNMRFCMRNEADGKVADFTTASGGIEAETWTHVAEVFDGENATVYFNGEEVGNAAGVGEMRQNDDCKFWIGSMYATDRWFNGLIDEVCIWKKALTPEEIQQSIDGTLISAAVSKEGKLAVTWGELK
ncbi:hypothetical protein GF312_10600 [Candidatus Poribacteria bacterium]|nr:hypothetical protein [Candidatus Poribacteria bacterium]